MNKLEKTNCTYRGFKGETFLDIFEKVLKAHDWAYAMSDDHFRYEKGLLYEEVLKELAALVDCEEARDMWSLYAYAPSFEKGRVPRSYPEGK